MVTHHLDCQVYSVDDQGHIQTQSIAQWHHRGEQAVMAYELEDGTIIRATPEHRFMTAQGEMLPIEQIFVQGHDLYRTDWVDGQNVLARSPETFWEKV